MEKTAALPQDDKRKKLPAWARWGIGWVLVLGAAVGLAYFWRMVFYLGALPAVPFTLGVAGIATLLYLALFLICRFCKQKLCMAAALCVFVLGLLFCFATAPLQVPDESSHFLRAYAVSMGRFDYDYHRTYPDDVDLLLEHFPGNQNHEMHYAGRDMAPAAFARYRAALEEGAGPAGKAAEPVMFLLLPYLPQALFMAVARLFGASALGLMYAGRMANLVLYALVCYAALRNCDKYRGVFVAFALLPLSLFMAASCSYDSVMLGMCWLLLSYFCKKEIQNRDLIVFGLVLVYISYLKILNIVLLAVLLLIPKSRWKTKVNPWAAAGVMLVAVLGIWYLGGEWLDGTVLKHNYPAVLDRGGGDAANPAAQLKGVLANPLRFVNVALLTLYEDAAYLFNLGTFGWMDLTIPLVSGLSVLSLAAGSALGIQQKDDTKNSGAVGLLLAALLYAGAVLAGIYVLESDLNSIRITGVQPRYFLPAFLLLFMLGSILLGKAVRPRLAPGAAAAVRTETITLWIAAGVALLSAVLLFQNYFIGQWWQGADGSWRMLNLLGSRVVKGQLIP